MTRISSCRTMKLMIVVHWEITVQWVIFWIMPLQSYQMQGVCQSLLIPFTIYQMCCPLNSKHLSHALVFFLKDVKKLSESVHLVFLHLHHMQCTPTKPHNESLALHTLWLLVIHSKRTLQTAGLLQAIEYVQITHDIGVALNIRLEEETWPLLTILVTLSLRV